MDVIIAFLVFVFVFTTNFVPMSMHSMDRIERKEVKQNINLSVKSLVNSIDLQNASYDVISLGQYLENEDLIGIDKDRLVTEFSATLLRNVGSTESFVDVQRHMPLMVLTYGDRYYVAEGKLTLRAGHTNDSLDNYDIAYQWLPVMFYTVLDDWGRLLYVNIRDETSYYYDNFGGGGKVVVPNSSVYVHGKLLTKELRDKVVIDSVNAQLLKATISPQNGSEGFIIPIRPANFALTDTSSMTVADRDQFYAKVNSMSNFNVLSGITFFVIYSADSRGYLRNNSYHYRNYNASGFTLSKRY